MYVLHHADKPEQYSGLPKDPAISTTVQLWKGWLKPLATVGIAAAGLFGFFHYITVGPNRPDEDDSHAAANPAAKEEDKA
jgi:formate dehydrogenase iron-sulfur subunit